MTDSASESISINNNNLTLPLGGLSAQIWPSNVIAMPLIDGVTVEVSTAPAALEVAFDLLVLLKGGKAAAKLASPPHPISGGLGKALTKAGSKAAAGAIAKSVASAHPGRAKGEEGVWESLKTFLGHIPGFDKVLSTLEELF